jgi:hypothetical protein
MRQHSPHLWLLKEGLLMTYLVAHFSALGVSNFVNTCVCVCVCVCFKPKTKILLIKNFYVCVCVS